MTNKHEYFFTNWCSFIILRHIREIKKASLRTLENIVRKTTSTYLHFKLNEQYLQHDLLPIYTNMHIYTYTDRLPDFTQAIV